MKYWTISERLEQLRRKYERHHSKLCTHPFGFPYSGEMPCTGPRACPVCGMTEEDYLKDGVKNA